MKISNQVPAVLSPVYSARITGDYDINSYIKKTMVEPIRKPIIKGTNVSIKNGKNNVTDDEIVNNIKACFGDTINDQAEIFVKSLYGKALLNYNGANPMGVQDLYAVQSADAEKLPYPDATTVYDAAVDIIPTCKEYLAGKASYDKLFTCFAFFAKPQALGFYFTSEVVFDEFKHWLDTEISKIANNLSVDVMQNFADFNKLTLSDLTESLKIRNDDNDNNDEYSFARILISYMMNYTHIENPSLYGVMPFWLSELFCPKSIIFINIEKHAHATAKQIRDEWDLINNAVNMNVKVASTKKLTKLTGAARNIKKITGAALQIKGDDKVARHADIPFSPNEPTALDFVKRVKLVMDKMSTANKTQNSYKRVHMTYAKPNRRNPDDYNKMGKSVSQKYRPDLHIYLDTSGSVSEENYRDAITSCIKMAKKFNINIYFNSFSHVLSNSTLLHTKDKSVKQIYSEFKKVPKVTGGTDYEQIWHYINRYPKRKNELSIIITDFEYWPPNKHVEHPRNLYYAPMSGMNWNYIVRCAEDFKNKMLRIEPDIRRKILF